MADGKLVTLTRHLIEEQKKYPDSRGEFSNMFLDLTLAMKIISREVMKAGLVNILGETSDTNIQGETVMKLDRFADDRIFKAMDHGGHLCCMASEECENLIKIPSRFSKGDYVLVFDPLDGSSNIDKNVSIGTIFAVLKRVTKGGGDGTLEDALQPGLKQVAAGYCIFGSSTMLVYTTGSGVHGFTLDPSVGEFLLSHENIQCPRQGKTYSINEGNSLFWDQGTKDFVNFLKQQDAETGRPYSLRYIGSLVADFHRNLLAGGVFLYPVDYKNPKKPSPKLRLLYEAAPLAFIAEQAGGKASTGNQRIMELTPNSLHERVPLVIGSSWEVEKYEEFYQKYAN
ncbi:MAG: class 1 fructose-bisphosphatase [Vulcanimicrobiota bacterium]